MKAVILAAGEGRRLRPLTARLPKPLLPVGGRPLLALLIELLRRHGVKEIAVNLHHAGEAIASYAGDGTRFGVRLAYSWEERLLGSAGGVRRLDWFLRDGPFFVLYGDVLTEINLTALRSYHEARGAAVTMVLYRPERLTDCGVVRLAEDGRIVDFVEKPPAGRAPSAWANAGIYIVEPSVLEAIPPDRPYDFGADLFPALLARGTPIVGYRTDALVVDIGSFEGYQRAQRAALGLVGQRGA